jgi:hypothetical protein
LAKNHATVPDVGFLSGAMHERGGSTIAQLQSNQIQFTTQLTFFTCGLFTGLKYQPPGRFSAELLYREVIELFKGVVETIR